MSKQPLFSQGWSEVTSGDRNEIIFERLNKTYGAYEIRIHYGRTLQHAFFASGLFLLLLSSFLLFPNSNPIKKLPLPIADTTVFNPYKPPTNDHFKRVPPAKKENFKDLIPEIAKDSLTELDTTTPLALLTYPNNGNNNDSGLVPPDGPGGGGKIENLIEKADPIFDGLFIEEEPKFPGGNGPMREFLQKNIVYPQYTKEIGGKGVVNVGFIVDKEGNITAVTLLNACKFPELNNEALRVVKKMPQWHPGRQQGNPVKVRMNLPIRFDLKQ